MSGSMKCPECGGQTSNTLDSRPSAGRIRRRRQCAKCDARYTTYEMGEHEMALALAALAAMDRIKAECVALVKRKKRDTSG